MIDTEILLRSGNATTTKQKLHCKREKKLQRLSTAYSILQLSKSNALVGEVYLLNWENDVFSNGAYIASLDFFMKLYKENPEFRYDTSRGTAMVIGRDYVSQSEESFSGNRHLIFLLSFLFILCFSA